MLIAEFEKTLTPPLKWAGGKRWQVPLLQRGLEGVKYKRLVEPFVGGLGVSLGLNPQYALLNDINPHLINLYQWLSRGLVLDLEMENSEDCYYRNRERFNQNILSGEIHTAEMAGLFYYLNRTCFNGLCRFNSKGGFNVPIGRYKTVNYVRDFTEYATIFKRWTFTLGDFESVEVLEGDLIYADPPHDVQFTTYFAGGFSWDDQEGLINWLAQYDVPTLISNQSSSRIKELYQDNGYNLLEIPAPRRISSSGDRTPALEVLAFRNIKTFEVL